MQINYTLLQLQSADIKEGSLVPLCISYLGDTETPVSVYQKLKSNYSHSFLLESAERDENFGRYSFLGFGARKIITFNDGKSELVTPNTNNEQQLTKLTNDPFYFLKQELSQTHFVYNQDLPRLQGGFVGFVSYDCVQYFHDIILPDNEGAKVPELEFVQPEVMVVFDNLKRRMTFLTNLTYSKLKLADEYEACLSRLQNLKTQLMSGSNAALFKPPVKSTEVEVFKENQEKYENNVEIALKRIHDGEIFQIVLSNKIHQNTQQDSLEMYRKLRAINPAPYMYLLDFGDLSVIGSSPETLVRVENGNIFTRPIAGTRPRGKDHHEDELLAKELMINEKELAEHRMLVDLARNDVGKVAEPGTVKVENALHVQKYSHVMHIVSDVVAKLGSRHDQFEAFEACFPAGTLSGAPKIRAMQTISQLENHRRGIYGGAVGYFDFSGNMDFAIAIRTIIKLKNDAYIQAGAGIVYDSHAGSEFQECLNKSLSSLSALA